MPVWVMRCRSVGVRLAVMPVSVWCQGPQAREVAGRPRVCRWWARASR